MIRSKVVIIILFLLQLPLEGNSRRLKPYSARRKDVNLLKSTQEALVVANKKLIKKDWCKTKFVTQVVTTEDGLCRGKIRNRLDVCLTINKLSTEEKINIL